MSIKGLIIIILLIVAGLFYVQNMQNITLVFFGINTISLPLSLVALSFILTGFISSLIIQFLSKFNGNKYRYNDNKFNEQKSPISPPSSSPSTEYYPSQKSIYQDNYQDNFVDNQETQFRDKFQAQPNIKFAQEEKISTKYEAEKTLNQPEILTQEIRADYPQPNKIKSPQLKQEQPEELKPIIIDQQEEIIADDNFNDVDEDCNLPSESITKPRQSSPYSYQTREKTEIITQQTRNKRLNNDDRIYTAPYRVITPADNQYYPPDVKDNYSSDDRDYPRYRQDNDDDEDWDF